MEAVSLSGTLQPELATRALQVADELATRIGFLGDPRSVARCARTCNSRVAGSRRLQRTRDGLAPLRCLGLGRSLKSWHIHPSRQKNGSRMQPYSIIISAQITMKYFVFYR